MTPRMTTAALLCLIFLAGCTPERPQPKYSDWKNNPQSVLTMDEMKKEIELKTDIVKRFLAEQKLDGMLFTQVRNVNWMTAGMANTQIVLNKDVGAATLLIMKDGARYLICSGSESGRLMDEVLGPLGYQLKMYKWYESNKVKDVRADILKEIAGKGRIGSDIDFPGAVPVADAWKPNRFRLMESELKRYRWLGRQATEAVAEVCRAVKPGMNEFEIEAMTSAALRARGILPTVLLTAVDERISKYRHALPGGAVLKSYAMINICAEKWGMPIAVTRFVHFGPLSDDLKSRLEKTARVNAEYEAATVPGTFCAEIFERCKKWYADAGYADEWQKHHQGGAIGYDDREYVIYPGVAEIVQEGQAFAWNPTITGAKVENTIIAFNAGTEVITVSDNWPMIAVELNGKKYEEPGILIR